MKKTLLMAVLFALIHVGCAADGQSSRAAKAAEEVVPDTVQDIVEAPDFTLPAIDGKELSLSSLRGKYVVIDFWGAWCKWCIKGIPDMKAYYEKYKDKLEILGVDYGDTEEAWKAAVKEHGLTWKHVQETRKGGSVLEQYAVQGFPTKVVISPEGNLLKTVIGEDPEFYSYLDELLSK